MQNKKLMGATIAAAAAMAFVVAPVTSFATVAEKAPCYGANACKGRSACKSAKNSCKGQNACKGQGVKMVNPQHCNKMHGSTQDPS